MAGIGGDIARLLAIMERLRDPEGGCPWDIRQTFESIAPYTVEEAYEVADAIRRDDMDALRSELGDLLLQVVYHAQMASEQGEFEFADVVESISDKMVRRHPHVFGSAERSESFGAVDWDREKARESGGGPKSALDGAASPVAPLARAITLGQRAARVGFDWEDADGTYRKIAEEIRELRQEEDSAGRQEELGDLLFAVVSLARHLGIDPEAALRRANSKFEARFRRMERILAERGESAAALTLEKLEEAWTEAKASIGPNSST